MVKTNSAAASRKIREYIRENYNPEGYDEYQQTDNIHKIAENILLCFMQEKVLHDKRNLTYEEYFLEWMAGLPTILNADYYLGKAVDTLGDILEQTEDERAKHTEEQAERKLSQMILRELRRAAIIV